ncbi:MAG TPA: hypothetical protein VKC63_07475 [Solirubrobacterales bacterium]|nr:hypothetical protein [Solirubrobacterales bacterium]
MRQPVACWGCCAARLIARPLSVAVTEPSAALASVLDAMLAGASRQLTLGAAAREAFALGADDATGTIADRVEPGDVVILHDTLTLLLAGPVRERGAHAVWNLVAPSPQAPGFRARPAPLIDVPARCFPAALRRPR